MSADEQKSEGAPQASPASRQRPKAGQKREAVIDTTPAAPPVARRPHYTRIKILSALQNGDGFFPAGYEGDFPDSEIADPRLAHVFGTPEQRRGPKVLPDTPDVGSPAFEPPLKSDDKSKADAAKAGY